jgi:hypothetical protein
LITRTIAEFRMYAYKNPCPYPGFTDGHACDRHGPAEVPRRDKPRDKDLAELKELARNVLEGAQERILTARLAALMQLPRCPAVRYYGCFAPNARARPQVVKAGAQAPCRRNKPRDLDLAELTELARNVPEGAQERIERYVAQEVERLTSAVLLLPRRPDSASMYSAAGSLPGTGVTRGVRHRHRKVHRVRRPAREPALSLSKGHRGDPARSHRAQDPDPPPFADDRGDPATV